MATLSIDLRERILAAYDREEGTRQQIAERFCVSLGMVKKLLQQRRRIGDIGPQHHCSGRKPIILVSHRQAIEKLLQEKPDLTLKELRDELKLQCSLPAIHYILKQMGLTYKKRHSGPASKIAKTSPGNVKTGSGSSRSSTRRDWFSSMNPEPKPI